jgi:alkylated DNA repair protein (DNA oxidative demethylase)
VISGELPRGFILQTDFLDRREERSLIDYIRTIPFGGVRMHGVTAKRRVAQFGWRYSFETYQLAPAAALPPEFEDVRTRAAALAGTPAKEFSETLVTEYPPGGGIGWHRDAPHFGIVAGISLGAECRMRFQRGKGEDRVTAAAILPARSIYLLTGEARSAWQHTIPAVRELRWSITFRTLRRTPLKTAS